MISNLFSPYLGYPKTKFGVYPFFFIFWVTIDIVLVTALTMFLYLKYRSENGSDLIPEQFAITVKQGRRKIFLKPGEIIWIGAEDYYIRLHTPKGDFLKREPLKAVLEKMPDPNFIRVHRSFVVNLKTISEFRSIAGYKGQLLMTDGSCCPVSKTYLKALKSKLDAGSY